MVSAQERLNQILPSWYDLLTLWSQDGSLVAAATDALMLESSNAKPDAKGQLQSLVSQWSAGDFKSLPEIVLLSNADISGAQGAYAASTGKIYLNADWLLTADQAWIQRVLTEELGHSLDTQLNLMDTPGDEGEAVSELLMPGRETEEKRQKISDANIVITLNGQNTDAEASLSNASWIIPFDNGDVECVTTTQEGASIVCGTFWNEVLLGTYKLTNATPEFGLDTFAAKFDQDGSCIWASQITGEGTAAILAVSSNSDGSCLITGRFSGSISLGAFSLTPNANEGLEIFVARINSDGTFAWAERAGGPNTGWESGESITTLTDGSSIVTGRFIGPANFGDYTISNAIAGGDGFITKLTPEGNFSWATSIGAGPYDIAASSDGSCFFAGYTLGPVALGSSNITTNALDALIAKISPTGSVEWAKAFGGGINDYTTGVSALSDGSAIITGWFQQTAQIGQTTLSAQQSDVFIARVSGDGNVMWATKGGGELYDYATDISSSGDGSAIVVGTFEGTAQFGGLSITADGGSRDIFVAKLNPDGSYAWATAAGGAFGDNATGVSILSDGSSVITGAFKGPAKFGNTTIDSTNVQGFAARLTADGKWGAVTALKNTGAGLFRINGNGTGQETQNLTCIVDTLDPDGMTKFPPSSPTGYTYQWEISADGSTNWTNATGTGNQTFKYSVNTTSDANKFLRVKVGYQDDKGFNETVYTGTAKIVSGTTKNDSFTGTSGVEVTFSGSGADAVATGAGNDFAKGGIGNDTFNGTDGDGDDFFDGQTEIDTLNYSGSTKGVIVDLVTGAAIERATGGVGKDTFASIENARGTNADDIFTGNTGVNSFTGVNGKDTYRFTNKQLGATVCDRITDFSNDTIELTRSAFGLAAGLTPSSSNFFASVSGTKAVNASAATLVYDTGTGYLYLNTDGAVSGVGTGGGVIAILANKAALTSSNFTLV
jgi:hypothetical protein